MFTSIKDFVNLAQVDETRARVMLAENRLIEAEKTVKRAVQGYERGDQNSLLAEALITHGIVLARLHHPRQACAQLQRAAQVANDAGDIENTGRAALAMLEELGTSLSSDDLRKAVECAQLLIDNTQDTSILRRLSRCVCRGFLFIHDHPALPQTIEPNFSFKRAVLDYEAHFMRLALKQTEGERKRAAELLGLKSHQSLHSLLKGRHKDLRDFPTPVTERRRSIINRREGADPSRRAIAKTVRILHVEDNEMVAAMVKETLEHQGWQVQTCADGSAALNEIYGAEDYDLLLIDYDLPGVNGLELVRRARMLAHRARTPIAVLSATPIEAAAREAGADVFLYKPLDINSVVETITRLLAESE